ASWVIPYWRSTTQSPAIGKGSLESISGWLDTDLRKLKLGRGIERRQRMRLSLVFSSFEVRRTGTIVRCSTINESLWLVSLLFFWMRIQSISDGSELLVAAS
ncbi:hypothetical protein HAX54_023705, partial [Datura stramonium]|nr:hypothetical protein [Datura stramonium]